MTTIRRLIQVGVQAGATALLLLSPCHAGPLVYAPVNPQFGGNPNNGPYLLSIAQAQNSKMAPTKSKLQQFNESLQQSILSHISAQTVNTMFGGSTTLTPGSYDTGAYTVRVTNLGNGAMQIQTIDKSDGSIATFTVTSGL